MSDRDRRTLPLTGRGGSPLVPKGTTERPPEQSVESEGRIEVRRETAPRDVGGIDVEQLALELVARMKPPEVELPFFGELAEEWFESVAAKRVQPENEALHIRRLKPLFLETEKTLTAAMVGELLDAQADLSASTKNKLRGAGRNIIAFAQARHRWERPNPFALVKRQKELRRKYELLSLDELYRVQFHLRADRLRLFRVTVHTGMRPGEVAALRVGDLDFVNRVIHVTRSRDRDTTKTGEPRDIPMHPAIMKDLLDAACESTSDVIFPDEGGKQQSKNTKLCRILRTAMAAAGVAVLHVDWKCRRKGCGFSDRTEGAMRKGEKRDCPLCDFRMWPVPKVRPVRWYDLRHCTATLHHQHGADRVCVALAMGHSLESITDEVYTHPSPARMAAELTKWTVVRV